MNSKIKLILLLAVITSVTALAQNGPDLLQKALRKERVDGDVKGAIELYQQIVKDHAGNRSLAAQALVQIGKGFEKLGAVEARSAYEQVISEYADQAKEVAEAKERLKTLAGGSAANAADGQLLIRKIDSDKLGHWGASDSRPSSDGRYLAVINWEHGNLAVCDTQSGETRDLTTEGTWKLPDQFTWGGVWSADSRQIAFIWSNGGDCDLRIVDRAGGPRRVLATFEKGRNVFPADWSKDGRYVVVLEQIKSPDDPTKERSRILRVEVSTGEVKVLKDLPGATGSVPVAVSPDSQRIVYGFPPGQLHGVNMDGSTDWRVIDHPAKYQSPQWLPDGKHLLFVSDRSGTDQLWAAPVKDGLVTGEPRLVRDGFQNARLLGVADDGKLHYTTRTPRFNVFVAEVDFEAVTMQTPQLVSLRNDGRNRNPRWSADGSQLVYVSRKAEGTQIATIVFLDSVTGKEREIENSGMNGWSAPPRWSPDLSQMVGQGMITGKDKNSPAMYLVDVQTGQRTMLFEKWAAQGNLTRDGKHMIYRYHTRSGNNEEWDLIERDLKSGSERVIRHHTTSGYGQSLVLSPDETKLAYCEAPYSPNPNPEDKTSLMITSRGDGATRSVWDLSKGRASIVEWLPDNRRVIVAVEDEARIQQLHLVDTETKSDRPIGPRFRRNDHIQHLSIHPGGKRIAFSRGDVIRELWTMENILPEKTRSAN